jgi:membrane-bound lytic murein transglycosylase F
MEQIKERGRVVMITQNSGSTYYLYREQPMGFEFDLASEFARYLNVDLEVVTPGWIEMFNMLNKGDGDFIAAGVAAIPH